MDIEILRLIRDYPGITGSDIAYSLECNCRNNLSNLINRSCVSQDPETSGFYLAPGGKYVLGDTSEVFQLAA